MNKDIAIKVDHVSMHFNLASERLDSFKEYVLKLLKRQLYYKDFVAVENVSLEIKKGEVFGIVGTNGSGKSTLLKVISGILKPTKGTVTIQGNIAPLIELGAGFDGELTARENIFLNGSILGYSKEFIEQHFEQIVEFSEMRDFLNMPIKNYSSGMVARIAFAIATVIRPDILIVDEILSVGDFLFRQKCEKRIAELKKMSDYKPWCDRYLIAEYSLAAVSTALAVSYWAAACWFGITVPLALCATAQAALSWIGAAMAQIHSSDINKKINDSNKLLQSIEYQEIIEKMNAQLATTSLYTLSSVSANALTGIITNMKELQSIFKAVKLGKNIPKNLQNFTRKEIQKNLSKFVTESQKKAAAKKALNIVKYGNALSVILAIIDTIINVAWAIINLYYAYLY